MKAGDLRHYITIQAPTTTQNTYGEKSIIWTSNKKVWGAVWPLRGDDYLAARGLQASITHRIRIRYTTLMATTEISPNNARISFDGRIFNLQSAINVDERSIYLDLMCGEEV